MTDLTTDAQPIGGEQLHNGGWADAAALAHLPEPERHRLLANEWRRAAVAVLAKRATPVELSELATAVADLAFEDPSDESVDRVALSLHHTHLPKLAAHDVLEYDPATNMVG